MLSGSYLQVGQKLEAWKCTRAARLLVDQNLEVPMPSMKEPRLGQMLVGLPQALDRRTEALPQTPAHLGRNLADLHRNPDQRQVDHLRKELEMKELLVVAGLNLRQEPMTVPLMTAAIEMMTLLAEARI